MYRLPKRTLIVMTCGWEVGWKFYGPYEQHLFKNGTPGFSCLVNTSYFQEVVVRRSTDKIGSDGGYDKDSWT